mmetsp:Transcript_47594/g.101851  ORF Transcript_47594/g.101851 Transcript_47594/m.101851 type:complete len:705 (+) Transcript_47594:152-2266(+)|eukprot:CAMPEP_0206485656 /NCGR_PEP_ID=MMETSP0324_2-20121206/40628_1 /ASSEMBLY_ACC=CAM_ASM_000836 /TAXON_ID=2866 /ORGANISM="Crypthecodinium cohnii, Strain Seligo" /LENGTH=704 /DNA_ID=CAMNT_0053963893 /DNA_START=149 /DNA_END=2263 /DNA_ORIENTATION=+
MAAKITAGKALRQLPLGSKDASKLLRALSSSASQGRSWVDHPQDTDFPLQNLPFGVYSSSRNSARCATAIGDYAVDLSALANAGLLANLPFDARSVFQKPSLNAFMALDRKAWRATRARLTELLEAGSDSSLKQDEALRKAALRPLQEVTMHLPAEIGDYTDFYSSREHATNVGIMFRGADNALQPNWMHLPVGYHGRASSVVVSGTPIVRPRGQLQADNDDPDKGSVYGPSRLLDIELEMGFFVGGPTPQLGRPITMEEAEDLIFGVVVMNDWSARDIQKWEYVPLGPFGAKNFGTTISPWVVTLDALEPFRCATSAGKQDNPVPLDYLKDPAYGSYDVQLEVDLTNKEGATTTISKSNFRNMYWNMKQQLVHHAVTGCNMRPGDLLGSGTISGQDQGSYGSMLELTWRGRDEIKLTDGSIRKFLQDEDTINLRGFCTSDGNARIGFGDCSGKILPAGAYDGVKAEPESIAKDFSKMTLYTYWRSGASWRVRTALAFHGVQHEQKFTHLLKDGGAQKTEEYKKLNSMAQVPSLVFEDSEGKSHSIAQSVAIIDFLDGLATSAGRPTLIPPADGPAGAVRRAQALQITELINSGIQPLHNLANMVAIKSAKDSSGAEVDGKGFATDRTKTGLEALEKLVSQTAGTFAVGNEVTIADVYIVPQVYSARRFGVDMEAFPTLLRIEKACSELPFFKAAHAENQPDSE